MEIDRRTLIGLLAALCVSPAKAVQPSSLLEPGAIVHAPGPIEFLGTLGRGPMSAAPQVGDLLIAVTRSAANLPPNYTQIATVEGRGVMAYKLLKCRSDVSLSPEVVTIGWRNAVIADH